MTKPVLRKEAATFTDKKGITHGFMRYWLVHTYEECGHVYKSPFFYEESVAQTRARWLESGQQLCTQCYGIDPFATKKIINDEQRRNQ